MLPPGLRIGCGRRRGSQGQPFADRHFLSLDPVREQEDLVDLEIVHVAARPLTRDQAHLRRPRGQAYAEERGVLRRAGRNSAVLALFQGDRERKSLLVEGKRIRQRLRVSYPEHLHKTFRRPREMNKGTVHRRAGLPVDPVLTRRRVVPQVDGLSQEWNPGARGKSARRGDHSQQQETRNQPREGEDAWSCRPVQQPSGQSNCP